MPAQYGQKSTLTASDADLRIAIEDTIQKYPDWQFPLLKRWGGGVFKNAVTSHKYEWRERELRPVKTTIASATVTDSATTFYVADAGVFNVDDKIRVQDSGEIMIVKSVSGGTLVEVEGRGWGGTTASAMGLGNVVYRQGTAAPQGKDADDMISMGPEDLFNFTTIYEDVVHLSGTQNAALISGDLSAAELIEDKQKELMEGLQADLLLGVRHKDALQKRYTMGGIKYFVDTYAPDNVVDFGGSATWNTDADVLAKLRAAVTIIANQNGGKPTIYMGWKAMDKFALIDNDTLRTTRNDASRGIGVVDTFRSLLGNLDVVLFRERTGAMDDLIFFVDEDNCGYKAMKGRAWFTQQLGKTGDNFKWQVVGEYTAKFSTPKVFSYIFNLGLNG